MRTIERLKPAIFACLLVLLLSPATQAQTTEPTAFSLKEGVVTLLDDSLPTGHKRSNRRIEAAIDFIEESLALELWVDGDHLVKVTGTEVFNAERQAIRKLDKILDDAAAPTGAVAAATAAIADLLAADALLAETALDDAISALAVADCDAAVPGGGGGDSDTDSDSDTDGAVDPFATDCNCNKAERRIARAEEKLALAMAAIDEGDFGAAINAYKRAWKKACKGGLAVAECPVVEISCPCAGDPLWIPFLPNGSALITGCFFLDDAEGISIQAAEASGAGVSVDLVPGDEAVCEANGAPPGGGSIGMSISEAEALVCIEQVKAAIIQDLSGGLGACS